MRHALEHPPLLLQGFHGDVGAAVPAYEAFAVIAVAVPLDVAQPQVKLGRKVGQHGLVHAPAKAIAMQKMKQGFTAGRAVPAADGEACPRRVLPGFEHNGCVACQVR